MKNIRLLQKLTLIIIGLFSAFLLLESGLRLGGYVFFALQQHHNVRRQQNARSYRILCIGESTTGLGGDSWAYPHLLETALNERQKKRSFTVINSGIPSATTTDVVRQLIQDIDKYKPHMVIAMLGINDSKDTPPFHDDTPGLHSPHLRTVKLFGLLKKHLAYKYQDWKKFQAKQRRLAAAQKHVHQKPSVANLLQLASSYADLNREKERYATLLQAQQRYPNNPLVHSNIVGYYGDIHDYPAMQKHLELTIKNLPQNSSDRIRMYNYLAICLEMQKQYTAAQNIYLYLMKKHPEPAFIFSTYTELINMFLAQKKIDQARELFFKQIALSPNALSPYGQIAHVYRREKKIAELETLLRDSLKITPKTTRLSLLLSLELGLTLMDLKKYDEAEAVFKETQANKQPDSVDLNDRAAQSLVSALQAQGKTAEAQAVQVKNLPSYYQPATVENYQKIRTLTKERGVLLVCMQYPMRPIAPLKQIIERGDDVFFIDNEDIFKDAVAASNYDDYFSDRFAGDFGHCTKKGNLLLAGNVADFLLTEILPDK